jgi:hypothetical protein
VKSGIEIITNVPISEKENIKVEFFTEIQMLKTLVYIFTVLIYYAFKWVWEGQIVWCKVHLCNLKIAIIV